MPATATGVLNIARKELGYAERPGNRTKYGRWYGLDGGPWCAIWVSWVADQADATDIIPRHAYTPAGAAWFEARDRYSHTPRRGDIAFYRFPGMGRISHVGIVETVHSDGSITALEGNTDWAGGRTGGRVMRKRRPRSLVDGFGHPAYMSPRQLTAWRKAEAKRKATIKAKAKAAAAAGRKKAAAALATKKRKAAAAAAAAALAAGLSGGAAVVNGADTPKPTPGISAAPTPSRTPYGVPTIHPVTPVTPTVKPVVLTRTLVYRKGRLMRGRDVAAVRALIGVRPGTLYTQRVAAAVGRWQKAHGLKVDREFGQASARKAGWTYTA